MENQESEVIDCPLESEADYDVESPSQPPAAEESSQCSVVASTDNVVAMMDDAQDFKPTSPRGGEVAPPPGRGLSAHADVVLRSTAATLRAVFNGMPDEEFVGYWVNRSLAVPANSTRQVTPPGHPPREKKKPRKRAPSQPFGQPQAARSERSSPSESSSISQANFSEDSSQPQAASLTKTNKSKPATALYMVNIEADSDDEDEDEVLDLDGQSSFTTPAGGAWNARLANVPEESAQSESCARLPILKKRRFLK